MTMATGWQDQRTTWQSIGGCDRCSITGALCRTCTALKRAYDAAPVHPLTDDWRPDCDSDARRVLAALLTQTDRTIGFSNLDLETISRQCHLRDAGSRRAVEWVAQQLRKMVAANLLETIPALPPDGMALGRENAVIWLRLHRQDAPRVWDGLQEGLAA